VDEEPFKGFSGKTRDSNGVEHCFVNVENSAQIEKARQNLGFPVVPEENDPLVVQCAIRNEYQFSMDWPWLRSGVQLVGSSSQLTRRARGYTERKNQPCTNMMMHPTAGIHRFSCEFMVIRSFIYRPNKKYVKTKMSSTLSMECRAKI
jgi:hypothetical protein